MKVTAASAINGAEVVLTSTKYNPSLSNPVYTGTGVKITGKITGIRDISGRKWIDVSWTNGTNNSYEDETLEYTSSVATTPSVVITPTATLATIPVPVSTVPVPVVPPIKPTATILLAPAAVSLKSAVEAIINREFIAKGLSFSGYDVTSKLRRDVNESRVRIENLAFDTINRISTQRITHDEVRVFVRDFMNVTSTYDRKFNGDYIVYIPNGTSAQASTKASLGGLATPSVTITPTTTVTSGIVGTSNFATKLQAYVASKGNPTLKQIQSRFKVKGADQITVRDIAAKVTALGLKLTSATPYYKSVVTR